MVIEPHIEVTGASGLLGRVASVDIQAHPGWRSCGSDPCCPTACIYYPGGLIPEKCGRGFEEDEQHVWGGEEAQLSIALAALL